MRSFALILFATLTEDVRRKQEREERVKRKEQKRQEKAMKASVIEVTTFAPALPPTEAAVEKPPSPIAFVFPGQGSQAIGMLKVSLVMRETPPPLASP